MFKCQRVMRGGSTELVEGILEDVSEALDVNDDIRKTRCLSLLEVFL